MVGDIVVKNKKENKEIFSRICFIIAISLLVISCALIGLIFINKKEINYYESEEYMQLSAYDKIKQISLREGLEEKKDMFVKNNTTYLNNNLYNFSIYYNKPDGEIGMACYIETNYGETNYSLTIGLVGDNTIYFLGFKACYDYDEISILATGKINAREFYQTSQVSFDTYYSIYEKEEDTIRSVSNNIRILIPEINKMLKNYNISLEAFGFVHIK